MVEITNLIEPDVFTVSLALMIMATMAIFAYLFIKMRHAILALTWFISVMVLVMVILVNLEFIWFWIMVVVMAATVSLAAVFRFFVIPARGV